MHVDCNSGYRLQDLPVFQALDSLGLAMIEQPLRYDDLLDHAELQRRLKTPVCLDETITSLERTRQAIDLGACGWINLKPARVGGLTPAVEILREAGKRGIPCWVGGCWSRRWGPLTVLPWPPFPTSATLPISFHQPLLPERPFRAGN